MSDILKEIEELRRLLNHHTWRYYVLNEPEITDFEYDQLFNRLKQLEDGFKQLKLEVVPSAANFILVRVGDGARVFAELQKLGVITRPMAGYQLGEWLRISIGTPKENARCLEALRQVLG